MRGDLAVVEILSPSTASDDRTLKLPADAGGHGARGGRVELALGAWWRKHPAPTAAAPGP